MSKINITTAKVLNEEVYAEWWELENEKRADTSKTIHEKPHPDLVKCMNKLAVHAALIGEFLKIDDIEDIDNPDHPELKKFEVKGFSLSGKNEERFTMSCQKTLIQGNLGFNTPLRSFDDTSDNAYEYLPELKKLLEKCKDEIREYLNGKHGEEEQGDLFKENAKKSDNGIPTTVDGKPAMKAMKGGKGKQKFNRKKKAEQEELPAETE